VLESMQISVQARYRGHVAKFPVCALSQLKVEVAILVS